ncbi:imidazole glycerol phosphate synthase cyclase subunit [Alphaproteobacteria bacterium]|nr:imidazole glycerol phosphate synthase cyclase subunit [Alphaproteobacteria bacterium]
MAKIRVIPRLDIKNSNLIKSIRLEGLRKLGSPVDFAKKYYENGADELLFNDCVASLYGRNSLLKIIEETAENIFIPLTVGGGITSIEEAQNIFRSGADKISLNSGAIKKNCLISDLAEKFGSQAVVVEIQAKQSGPNEWEALFENGREHSRQNAVDWAKRVEKLGAGEILLTSVDREGTALGFDIELIQQVMNVVSIPLIVSGGMGKLEHLSQLLDTADVSGISCAHVLHYDELNINTIKSYLSSTNRDVRK